MSWYDRLRGRSTSTEVALSESMRSSSGALDGVVVPVSGGSATVLAEQQLLGFLAEALADQELAMEDAGWRRLTAETTQAFTRDGLAMATEHAQAAVVSNALLRRGVALRIAYVWGGGVQVAAKATGADNGGAAGEQDVNAVVQAFLDDKGNRKAVTGEQAHEEIERSLATDGQVFIVAWTGPKTGKVRARLLPWTEIREVITNPEDRTEPWYYVRQWTATELTEPGSRATTRQVTRRELYPAMGYRPATRLSVVQGLPVHWDGPVIHVSVNRLSGWTWGIGDVFPALPWARGYSEFLTDWAKLVKALSKYAFRLSGQKESRAQRAAREIREQATSAMAGQGVRRPEGTGGGSSSEAGQLARTGVGQTLEAVPKTGATIDSESGRPLAAMVAAALDVPVTMLLADPGTTGNRATAETLDRPTELSAQLRRQRHSEWIRELLEHVIRESVRAPQGQLRGLVKRDEFGTESVTLAGDTDPTVEVSWPDLTEDSVKESIDAVDVAAGLAVLPKLVIARLALRALKVDNVDEVLEELTDDDGNFIDPEVDAGVDAVRRHRRGEDEVSLDPGAQQQGQQPEPAVPAPR